MATLYLHIGTHKTGTTAIQRFCDENREALMRRGYCYPVPPCKYKTVSINRNGRFLVIPEQDEDGTFESPRAERAWRRRFERVVKLFRRYPNIVLSEEILWNNSSFNCRGLWTNVKRMADAHGFEVRIIVYLRRQDQFISSLWAQRVKALSTEHGKMRWEEALAQADNWIELDYHRHLDEIAAYFGRDHIDARIYDRDRFPDGNVIPDFLSALGLQMDGEFVLSEDDRNPSIAGNSLEIKRIINTLPNLRRSKLDRVRRAVEACYALEREKVSFSMFSEEELRAFLARYEESNRLLARDYLGGGDASPFREPGPLPPKWTPDNPYMSETIANFIGIYASQRNPKDLRWYLRFLKRNLRRLRSMV